MTEAAASATDGRLEFERARYEYCLQIYEREVSRKDALERKAQLYLTLLALFVGAVFLKIEVLTGLRDLLRSSATASLDRGLLIISASVFSLSLLVSLACVLFAVHVRGYAIEYPSQLVTALFRLPSDFLSQPDEVILRAEGALALATAFEEDRKQNDRKARWISRASVSLFVMLFALAVILGALAYIAFRSGGV
jgi:hypothetical protein